MSHKLRFTEDAKTQLRDLETDPKKLKKVRKCLGRLEIDPKHNGLNTHKYSQMKAENNQGLWESYVENNTPAAWRVFWIYGPEKGDITIVAITEHP